MVISKSLKDRSEYSWISATKLGFTCSWYIAWYTCEGKNKNLTSDVPIGGIASPRRSISISGTASAGFWVPGANFCSSTSRSALLDFVWMSSFMVAPWGASPGIEEGGGGKPSPVAGGCVENHLNQLCSSALAFQFVYIAPKVHARATAAATDFTVPLLASSSFFLSMPSSGGVMCARTARLNGLRLGRALRPVQKNGEKFSVIWLGRWRKAEPAWQRARRLCWILALGPVVRRHREACMVMLVGIACWYLYYLSICIQVWKILRSLQDAEWRLLSFLFLCPFSFFSLTFFFLFPLVLILALWLR